MYEIIFEKSEITFLFPFIDNIFSVYFQTWMKLSKELKHYYDRHAYVLDLVRFYKEQKPDWIVMNTTKYNGHVWHFKEEPTIKYQFLSGLSHYLKTSMCSDGAPLS